MSKRVPRGQVSFAFVVAGLVALWVSLQISQPAVTTADSAIGIIIAVIGAVASLALIAVAVTMMLTKRSFLALNPLVVLSGYLAILVIILEGAAYIVFLAITVGMNVLKT